MQREMQKRLQLGQRFLQKRLVHLHMQVLYHCNFKCQICHFWKSQQHRPRRMELSQAAVIADKLKGIGPLIICLGGGEPLVHTKLLDIARLFAKDHFLSLISNGWFITPQMARELFQTGIQHVAVSVDYADPDKHDRLRGVDGAHQRALSALRYLQQSRTHASQRVHMISVVLDDNINQIEPLLQLSGDLGVSYLVNMYSSCRGSKDDKNIGNVSQHLLKLHKKYDHFVSTPGYLSRFNEASAGGVTPCYAGKNLFNIDSQGNVGLCLDRLEEPVGNILSEEMPALEKKLLQAYGKNRCGDCWTSCRGGIEPQLYGKNRWRDLWDSQRLFQEKPLEDLQASGSPAEIANPVALT